MARYRYTFAGDQTGAGTPAGVTVLESTNGALAVVADAGSEGGKALEISKSGAGVVRITLDRAGTGTEQDIVVLLEVSASGTAPGVIINSTGGVGAANEYLLEAFGTALTIWEAASGSYTSRVSNASALGSAIASGTQYAMRVRRSGSTIYGRIWVPASEHEPSAWHVQYTDPSPRSAGGMGVRWASASETLTVHYLSAATGGDCGCELADENFPLRGVYVTSETDGSVTVYDEDDASINAVVSIMGDTSIANLRGITCHNRDREVYVVKRASDDVTRINRWGRNATDVVTTLTDPYGVAVDPSGDLLFISDRAATTVSSTPVHAISLTTIENPGASDFCGYLFWDPVGSKLWRASVSGVYSANADGTGDTDYDDLTEELQAITDGTTVMASDYTAAGGIYTKPVASPGDSWTAVDTTSPIEGITLNTAADACWGIDNTNGAVIKWSSFPAASANRSTFASKAGVRAVCYFDFTAEAWPADELLISAYELESDGSDSVGSNDLTAVNTPAHVSGIVGNAAEFDASTQNYYRLPNADAASLQIGTEDVAVQFWFEVLTLPGSQETHLFSFGGPLAPSGLDPGVTLWINSSGQLLARASNGSGLLQFTASGTYAAGQWYHVAMALRRTGSMVLYVDGQQVGTIGATAYIGTDLVTTEDFEIGGAHNQWYDGLIDAFRWYKRVPSLWEGLYDINNGAGRTLSALQTTGYARIASMRSAISNNNSVTDLTNGAPAGVTAGDLLLYIFAADADTGAITAPVYDGGTNDTLSAGFTTHLGDGVTTPSTALYSKAATSDDAAQSTNGDGYSIAWATIEGAASTLLRITGHDGVDAVSSIVYFSGPTDPVSPGVTTTTANCLVLDIIVVDDSAGGNLTVDAPEHTAAILNEYHAVPGATGGIVLSVAARHQATAGDTGAVRWTLAAGRAGLAWSVAIAPEATASASGRFAHDAGATFAIVAAKTGLGQMAHHGAGTGAMTATKAAIGQLAHDLGAAYSAQAAKGALGQIAHDVGITGYALSAEVIIRTGQFAHDAAAAFATQASKIGLGQFAYDLGATASAISALIRTGQIAYDAGDAGYAISAKTAAGQTVYDGDAIGHILGSNPADLDPSTITISIARLHAIGIEIARLHNITLTISRPN